MRKASTKVERQRAWNLFEKAFQSRRSANSIVSSVATWVAMITFPGFLATGFGGTGFLGTGVRVVAEGARLFVHGAALFSAVTAATANALLDIHSFRDELGDDVVFLLEVEAVLRDLMDKPATNMLLLYNRRDCTVDVAKLVMDWTVSYSLGIQDHCRTPMVDAREIASAFILLSDELAMSPEFHRQMKELIEAGTTLFMQGRVTPEIKKQLIGAVEGGTKGLDPKVCHSLLQLTSSPLFTTGFLTDFFEKTMLTGTKRTIMKAMDKHEYAKILKEEEEESALGVAKSELNRKIQASNMSLTKKNIAVVGWVNKGKTSLLNALFGAKVGKVGQGEVTATTTPYCYSAGLQFWDHPGIGAKVEPFEGLPHYVKKHYLTPIMQNGRISTCSESPN